LFETFKKQINVKTAARIFTLLHRGVLFSLNKIKSSLSGGELKSLQAKRAAAAAVN